MTTQDITQNTLALAGIARIWLVFSGCGSSLPLVLTQNNGSTGVGAGGIVTVGFPGPIRVSLVNSPWQLKTATRLASTANGVVITRMHHGFVHGPGSNTSSTAKPSGVIQLITRLRSSRLVSRVTRRRSRCSARSRCTSFRSRA